MSPRRRRAIFRLALALVVVALVTDNPALWIAGMTVATVLAFAPARALGLEPRSPTGDPYHEQLEHGDGL